MSGTIKVGFLQEFGMVDHAQRPWDDLPRMTLDEPYEDSLADRSIELVHKRLDGLPTGSHLDLQRGWQELADEGVVAILGPITSENAISLRSHIEDVGHLEGLTWQTA
jgi:hypothetical protein